MVCSRQQRERGFSLVGLLAVLAILGLLSRLMIPALAQWIATIRLNASIRTVAASLELARVRAIALHTRVQMCLYPPQPTEFPQFPAGFFSIHERDTGWCPAPPAASSADFVPFMATVQGFPANVRVTFPPSRVFLFSARGFATTGTLTITHPRYAQQRRLTVSAIGRVQVETLQ